MAIGLHGAPQRLLGDMGERVRVVNDDPPIHLFVVPRRRSHLPNKETHVRPNGLDAPITIGCQEQALLQGLLAPQLRRGPIPRLCIVLQKVLDHGGLSGPRGSC